MKPVRPRGTRWRRARGWLDVGPLFLLALAGAGGVAIRVAPRGTLIDGRRWNVALECDFSEDWCPAGWGWGDWSLDDGVLTGRAPVNGTAVYLYGVPASSRPAAWDAHTLASGPTGSIGRSGEPVAPFDHPGAFLLETEVRLLPGPGLLPSEAQMLVRGGEGEPWHVTGVTLVLGADRVTVRYQVPGELVLVRRPVLETAVDSAHWYRLRFALGPEQDLRAWVDGIEVFDSETAKPAVSTTNPDTAAIPSPAAGIDLPPGKFTEPHLAVRGTAQFRYVRLYTERRSSAAITLDNRTGGGP